eukprot:COSAG05_NODE_2827_length_2594_cov_36.512811_6_plen_73_part_00
MLKIARARAPRGFQAAARFDNLKKVILTILTTLPELANFFVLLSLFVFFYAVLGLQVCCMMKALPHICPGCP